MPELDQDSTSPPPPPTFIPSIDPADWESFPVFRETFMMYITPPQCGEALRTAAEMFFSLMLEHYGEWPGWSESATRIELRAAAADLRHLEGFLATVGTEHEKSTLDIGDIWLSKMAAKLAPRLGGIAAKIEMKLAEIRS